jgi:CDGSH-type Zn-finger protein
LEVWELEDDAHVKIKKNGPYLVYGGIPVTIETIEPNSAGGSGEWKRGRAIDVPEKYALCRCGASATKPLCDGTHQRIGFDGTETASRERFETQAGVIEGPGMVLRDAEPLCAFARFCDNDGSIWNLIEQTGAARVRAIVAHEGSHCPSGRLVVRERTSGEPIEPEFEPSIGLIEDPGEDCSGPLWVRGGIRIEAADGTSYEVRNRVTLCRCGASQNKPFCDGRHAAVKFNDGL